VNEFGVDVITTDGIIFNLKIGRKERFQSFLSLIGHSNNLSTSMKIFPNTEFYSMRSRLA